MARPEKIRLGEILLQQKLLTSEQLKSALDEQKASGRRFGRVLIDKGFVTEEQISEALARQLNIPYINLKFYNVARFEQFTTLSSTSSSNSTGTD